jgi:histidinol-phosphate aminotransferase
MEAKKHLMNLERKNQHIENRYDLLNLEMNENVDGLPIDFVQAVLKKISPRYLSMYPEYQPLKELIAQQENISSNEMICLSCGSDGAIKYLYDAFIEKGDIVLIADPSFAMYEVYSQMADAKLKKIPYVDFTFPEAEFVNAIDSTIKMAVIVNPNNPTGTVLSKETIIEVAEKCLISKVLLVVDEAYHYFYPETVIDLTESYPNVVVLRTFSKMCGLAAARIGYAVADRAIVKMLRKVRPTYDVNGFGVLFAESILASPRIIKKMTDDFIEGRRWLENQLTEHRVPFQHGHASFILIMVKRSEEAIAKLKAKGVLVGGGFRQEFLSDYIRVSIGSEKVMEKFWSIFKEQVLEVKN